MRLTEFYKELRKLRGKYQYTEKGMIRAINPDHTGYCPIIGVAWNRGGVRRNGFLACGIQLGLTARQIYAIVDAADRNKGHKPSVRKALLKALEL